METRICHQKYRNLNYHTFIQAMIFVKTFQSNGPKEVKGLCLKILDIMHYVIYDNFLKKQKHLTPLSFLPILFSI